MGHLQLAADSEYPTWQISRVQLQQRQCCTLLAVLCLPDAMFIAWIQLYQAVFTTIMIMTLRESAKAGHPKMVMISHSTLRWLVKLVDTLMLHSQMLQPQRLQMIQVTNTKTSHICLMLHCTI